MIRSIALLAVFLLVVACGNSPEEEAVVEGEATASGLRFEILREGKSDSRPRAGDLVTVHYTGWLADGTRFQSSRDGGKPFEFTLGEGKVIAGWDEGVALMNEGALYRFGIPSALAYKAAGRPPRIPPNADLTFEVELLKVTRVPRFRPGNPERQVRSASGLVFEPIEEGDGATPTASDGVTLDLSLFNHEGKFLLSSALSGQPLAGVVELLKLGNTKMAFLPEACTQMKVGGTYRVEVPAVLAWGDESPSPEIPAGSVTIWELTLHAVHDVPAFQPVDPALAVTTETGLMHQVLAEGDGPAPASSSEVEVHYTGWFEDGRIFDSSHGRGETTSFPLQSVIAGWTEGLQLMRVGGKSLFFLPASIAYGSAPPPGIPPGANLIFLVELVRIVR